MRTTSFCLVFMLSSSVASAQRSVMDQKINLAVKYIRSHVANLPGQKR